MKIWLMFVGLFLAGIVVTISCGSLLFSIGAVIGFILGILMVLAGIAGGFINLEDAVDDVINPVKDATRRIIDSITRELGAHVYSYNSPYSVAKHLYDKGEKNLAVTLDLPGTWDYKVGMYVARYQIRKELRELTKTRNRQVNTKKVKVKL